MLISHHPLSSEALQLGEGVLLADFALDEALESTDPLDTLAEAIADENRRIGTTCGGSVFRAVPREFNREAGANRLPCRGSTLLVSWRVTLSGTLMDMTPENWARLLPGQGLGTPTPFERLCWIGSTSRGLLLLELLHPLAISGAVLQSRNDQAGRMPFTLLAQNKTPDDPALPVRIYWWKEDADAII